MKQENKHFWIIISSIVAICSVLIFEIIVFVALPSSLKYILYRVQFYVVLNIVFIVGSRILWRNLVTKVMTSKTPAVFKVLWKITFLCFLFLAHIAPLTTMFLYKDPLIIGMMSWICFGGYILLFCIHLSLKMTVDCLSRFKKVKLLSARKQAIFAVVTATLFTYWGVMMAISDPQIVR